ncbi:arsenosugar biosynthesis-associated peroxidase-like protein [Paraburkholderia terrae]
MSDSMYPLPSMQTAALRKERAPEPLAKFKSFSDTVFAEGALPGKTKQLIAVAVAHVTQCPYCIRGHTASALKHGATQQEIMEAIWVAAEMRDCAAYAHSVLAIEEMNQQHNAGGAGHGVHH